MIDRRAFLALAAAASAAHGAAAAPAAGPGGPRLGRPEPMDFDRLAEVARSLRGRPASMPPASPADAVLDRLTYGPRQEITYPTDRGLFPASPYPATFFHLGDYFRHPVRMFALEGGQAREVVYSRDLFRYPPGNPAADMPDGAGFAGFRLQNAPAGRPGDGGDWAAFLGASYFRCDGDGRQYGASARGVAVDTAPGPGKSEEFPAFTRFYVSPYESGGVTVLALLEGESLTGAYRLTLYREPNAVVDVDCRLFLRKDVDRLGIAPVTSMMWYSEGISRFVARDWRPEIHDSDGLLMRAGTGEAIWRPLNNPPRVCVSAFADRGPKGFGLLQRDRDPSSYIDDGAMERRPHVWVEPRGDWGPGSVQLVEIPAHQEYDDNIGAMWVPAEPARAGQDLSFSYRIRWPVDEPVPSPLARCVATRAAKAAWLVDADRRPGRPNLCRQFVLEFAGQALAGLDPERAQVSLTLSRGVAGEVGAAASSPGAPGPWRASFKVYAEGPEPVEMRLFLKDGDRTLSETWLYQYFPEQPGTLD